MAKRNKKNSSGGTTTTAKVTAKDGANAGKSRYVNLQSNNPVDVRNRAAAGTGSSGTKSQYDLQKDFNREKFENYPVRTPEEHAQRNALQREAVRLEGITKVNRNIILKDLQDRERERNAKPQETTSLPVDSVIEENAQPFQQGLDHNAINATPVNNESFFDRLTSGEISDDPGFNREVNLRDLGQIGLTGLGIGVAAIGAGIGLAAATTTATVNTVGGTASKVAQAATGKLTSSVIKETIKLGGGRVMVNTYTAAKTGSWIARLGTGLVTNPTTLATTILATVGTYPFAGFVKEEALQTLGFAVKNAIENGDVNGAIKASNEMKEMLNPTVWRQILNAIPSVNILAACKDYYTAAGLQSDGYDKQIQEMITGNFTPSPRVLAEEARQEARFNNIREENEKNNRYSYLDR